MKIDQEKISLQIRPALKPTQSSAAILEDQRPRILTVSQVAKLLQIPKSSVYERTRRRIGNTPPLPCRRVGKYLRFFEDEVLAWLVNLPPHRTGRAA